MIVGSLSKIIEFDQYQCLNFGMKYTYANTDIEALLAVPSTPTMQEF